MRYLEESPATRAWRLDAISQDPEAFIEGVFSAPEEMWSIFENKMTSNELRTRGSAFLVGHVLGAHLAYRNARVEVPEGAANV